MCSSPASLSAPVLKEEHSDWETALATGKLMAKRMRSMDQIQVVEIFGAIEAALRKCDLRSQGSSVPALC